MYADVIGNSLILWIVLDSECYRDGGRTIKVFEFCKNMMSRFGTYSFDLPGRKMYNLQCQLTGEDFSMGY